MCLTVKNGCTIEIAKKDITTYKKVIKEGSVWIPPIFEERAFPFNTVITALKGGKPIKHLLIENKGCRYCVLGEIQEGFHSYSKYIKDLGAISTKVAICIIPKGAEYCYGTHNEIVSTQLIVFSNKLQYIKYKINKLWNKKS